MTHTESALAISELADSISAECQRMALKKKVTGAHAERLRGLAQKLSCAAQELELRVQGVAEPVCGK